MNRIIMHLMAWSAYGIYFYLVNRMGNQELSPLTVLLSLPIFMLVYYGISYSLKGLLISGKPIASVIFALGIYALVWGLVYLLTHGLPQMNWLYGQYRTSKPDFDMGLFAQTYVKLVGNFTILAILTHQYRLREFWAKREGVERKKSRKYEYTLLAQQVSPHLLANAFLSIERKLSAQIPGIRKGVMDLYFLMNHFMESCDPSAPRTVVLSQEIQAAKKFVVIQGGFSENEQPMDWKEAGDTTVATIPSTALIALVSNVLKHGMLGNDSSKAVVQIQVEKYEYSIRVSNPILAKGKNRFRSHGVGLVNLRRRLEYAFNDRFELNYGTADNLYQVFLRVRF